MVEADRLQAKWGFASRLGVCAPTGPVFGRAPGRSRSCKIPRFCSAACPVTHRQEKPPARGHRP
jgi:hypothetical protein